MIAYLAGPITDTVGYKEIFKGYADAVRSKGYIVLNPAVLPEGMPADKYLPICLEMLRAADIMVLLPGWDESKGVNIEARFAKYQGIEIAPIESLLDRTIGGDQMENYKDVENAFRENHPDYQIKIEKFIGGVFITIMHFDHITEKPFRYRLDYFDMKGLYNCAELLFSKHIKRFGG